VGLSISSNSFLPLFATIRIGRSIICYYSDIFQTQDIDQNVELGIG
jgi:hypothetical protein